MAGEKQVARELARIAEKFHERIAQGKRRRRRIESEQEHHKHTDPDHNDIGVYADAERGLVPPQADDHQYDPAVYQQKYEPVHILRGEQAQNRIVKNNPGAPLDKSYKMVEDEQRESEADDRDKPDEPGLKLLHIR